MRIILTIFLISASPGLLLAGGYNLAGVGAKALAMAGAFRAISDDYSAVYWNPAGLAGQRKMAVLDGKVLYPMVWLTPNVSSPNPGYPGYEGYRNGVEQTTKANSYMAPTFGLTYPVNDRFTAGLGVYAPSALGAEWVNLFTGPPYGYNNTTPYPERSWFSDLKVIDFHPTLAIKATDRIKLGIGIAAQYGDITLESPKLAASGAPFPYQSFYIDATLTGSGWGTGFNAGILYDIRDDLALGIAYRGETTIAVEGQVEQILILPYSRGIQAADPSKAALFSGGSLTASPDATADFPLPADFGMGLAWKCCKLTLAYDFTWTNWGSVKDVTIKMNGNGPTGEPATDTKLVLRYKDTIKMSIGADYLLYEPKNVHLRAGFYTDPSPIPNGSLRPTITDVADKNNLSFGFSHDISDKACLEGYYERVWSGTRTVTEEDMDADGEVDNLPGDWKMEVNTFGLSLSYKF
jgi:long-chain fatty acid transport protein